MSPSVAMSGTCAAWGERRDHRPRFGWARCVGVAEMAGRSGNAIITWPLPPSRRTPVFPFHQSRAPGPSLRSLDRRSTTQLDQPGSAPPPTQVSVQQGGRGHTRSPSTTTAHSAHPRPDRPRRGDVDRVLRLAPIGDRAAIGSRSLGTRQRNTQPVGQARLKGVRIGDRGASARVTASGCLAIDFHVRPAPLL